MTIPRYEEIFSRNTGLLLPDEQVTIRNARILIVGVGGIGSTVAFSLARTGVEHFCLVDFDTFSPSNLNRQMGSTVDSIGRNKAEVLREEILRINPAANVEAIPHLLSHAELSPHLAACTLVLPAADDYAFSLVLFRMAQQMGKPALCVFPAGLWCLVSLVRPQSPPVEQMFTLPVGLEYEELHSLLHSPEVLRTQSHLVSNGYIQPDHFEQYSQGQSAIPQICPFVWMSASLGSFEIVKYLTGRLPVTSLPNYWKLTAEAISRESLV
jgi:molybdopterin/thiamine biosynthesis adenylyltransferase